MTPLLQQVRALADQPDHLPKAWAHKSLFSKIADRLEYLEARVAAMPPEDPTFDVVAHVQQTEARGDIRNEFARRAVERTVL